MTRVPEVTLGWRLQMSLAHSGVSAQEMADELGVSRSSVSRWMNDHGTPPRRAYVIQWAMKCGVDSGWLLTGQAPDMTNSPRPTRPSGLWDGGFPSLDGSPGRTRTYKPSDVRAA